MNQSILVAKGNHIVITDSFSPVKAIKDFDLAEALRSFNSCGRTIEEGITSSADNIFSDQFESWLKENGYVKEAKQRTVFSVSWNEGQTNHISVFVSGEYSGESLTKIPFEIKNESKGYGSARNFEWKF